MEQHSLAGGAGGCVPGVAAPCAKCITIYGFSRGSVPQYVYEMVLNIPRRGRGSV